MKVVCPITDISTSWYRDFTTNPIWKTIKICEQSDLTTLITLNPCKGFLPLQWTQSKELCDNLAYICADRSDEGDCRGIKEEKISVVSFSISNTSLLIPNLISFFSSLPGHVYFRPSC